MMNEEFKIGDIVEFNPEFKEEITYTNTPNKKLRYSIKNVYSGETKWKYALNDYPGGSDACIVIEHNALVKADLSKSICFLCSIHFIKIDDLITCDLCKVSYVGYFNKELT